IQARGRPAARGERAAAPVRRGPARRGARDPGTGSGAGGGSDDRAAASGAGCSDHDRGGRDPGAPRDGASTGRARPDPGARRLAGAASASAGARGARGLRRAEAGARRGHVHAPAARGVQGGDGGALPPPRRGRLVPVPAAGERRGAVLLPRELRLVRDPAGSGRGSEEPPRRADERRGSPEPQEDRRPLALILVLFLSALLGARPALADRIHLSGGGTVEADSWWVEGDTLQVEGPSGTIGLPRSLVVRIERSEPRPAAALAVPAPASPQPAPAAEDVAALLAEGTG